MSSTAKLRPGVPEKDAVFERLFLALRRADPAFARDGLAALLTADAAAFRSPFACFDARFYGRQLPAELARGISPLRHYLEVGQAAGLAPHPCFDMEFLRGQPSGGGPALLEILEAVTPPYATPTILFEPELYAANLPAGALEGQAPFEHFLKVWQDYRVPFSRYFDVPYYLHKNRHVARVGLNPLVHYFSQSVDEREDANPMVHQLYYAASNPRVQGDPFVHYLRFGLGAGFMPNPYAEDELRVSLTGESPAFQAALLEAYVRVA